MSNKLGVSDAYEKMKKVEGYKIKDILEIIPETERTNHTGFNKGQVGQLVESYITGEKSTSKHCDLKDGEIKIIPFTSLGDFNGKKYYKPKETMKVNSMSSTDAIDDFLSANSKGGFKKSVTGLKLNNTLCVLLDVTNKNEAEYTIIKSLVLSKKNPIFSDFYKKLEEGFDECVNSCNKLIKDGKLIHTDTNNDYLQVRPSANSKKKDENGKVIYKSVFSKIYNKDVADKGRGIFMKKPAITEMCNLSFKDTDIKVCASKKDFDKLKKDLTE